MRSRPCPRVSCKCGGTKANTAKECKLCSSARMLSLRKLKVLCAIKASETVTGKGLSSTEIYSYLKYTPYQFWPILATLKAGKLINSFKVKRGLQIFTCSERGNKILNILQGVKIKELSEFDVSDGIA